MLTCQKLKNFSCLTFIIIILGTILFPLATFADYKLEIPLPGMPKTISDPGTYVRYLFIFGLSLIGFLAVGAIIVGGIMYMTAGSVGSVDKAKQYIIGALSGIALLLCSYLLLTTIDPTLKNLSPANLKKYGIQQQNTESKMSQLKATTQVSYGCYSLNGDEIGTYSSLADCQKDCSGGSCSTKQIKETFFTCVQSGEVGQGYGRYSTYQECLSSGCEKGGAAQCQYEESIK
jgi:hypothetical protein